MKLCLIALPMVVSSKKLRYFQTPPLGVAYLAAYARQAGHDVAVVDGLGEALDCFHPFILDHYINGLTIDELVERVDPQTEIIGVSVMFSNHWPFARRLLASLRKAHPSSLIAVGGEHVSALTAQVLEGAQADYAIVGEGEETFVELLDVLSRSGQANLCNVEGLAYLDGQGRYVQNPPRSRRRDIDSLPWPAWDLIPIRQYMEVKHFQDPSSERVMTMLGTRGCPYRCKFCSSAQMWTTRFYMRNPKDLVDEMEFYMREFGATEFQFQDLTFVINRRWVIEVAEEISARSLGISWKLPSGTRSEAFDAELLEKMSASGCKSLTLAPESGSQRVLAALKKPADLERFLDIGRTVRRKRIKMVLNFYIIVGAPEETLRDLLETYSFITRMAMAGYDAVGFNKFISYPGSEYHREFVERGLIDYSDEYFLSLDRRFTNLQYGPGIHPARSEAQLKLLITFGYLLFFGVYYLSHPFRIVRSVKAILRNEPVTRLEAIGSYVLTEPAYRLWARLRGRVVSG